jgi:hypothetical protein
MFLGGYRGNKNNKNNRDYGKIDSHDIYLPVNDRVVHLLKRRHQTPNFYNEAHEGELSAQILFFVSFVIFVVNKTYDNVFS